MSTGIIAVIKTCGKYWFAFDAEGIRCKNFGHYGNSKDDAVARFIKCFPEAKYWKIEESQQSQGEVIQSTGV